MRRSQYLLLPVVFLLASAFASAWAAEPPRPGSTTALAVVVSARDPGANETAAALEQALTKAIDHDGRLKPMDLLQILGGEPQVGAPKAEVEEHFKKGKDAYDNLDLDAAAAEYLDRVVSVRVVDSLDAAIQHINQYGSGHTDSIVTENYSKAMRFLREVDSSSVMVNASTRFADGFEYGLGAEIGISTDKLHARGPVGLEGLTSQKYIVLGNGQIRT